MELGFDCPACGDGVQLAAGQGPLKARRCTRCGGALLGPAEARRFRQAAVIAPGLPPRPLPPLPCPSCATGMAQLAIGDTPYAACQDCAVAWVGAGPLLGWVEARLGVGAMPAAPRRSRRSAWPFALGVAALGACALAAAVLLRPPPAVVPAPPPPLQPAPAPQPPPPAAAAATATTPAAEPPVAATLAVPAVRPLGVIEELPPGPGRPQILLAPRAGPLASLVVQFHGGAVDESPAGITRVAQHALLAANGRLDLRKLARDLHAAAADVDLTTGAHEATFRLTADARDFPALLRELAPALLAPRFLPARLPEALDRTRLDDPTRPDLLESLAALAGNDPRYTTSAVPGDGELDAIEAQHVARALAGPLSAGNATVVLAGAFDRDAALKVLGALQGGEAGPRARIALSLPFSTRRRAPEERHLFAFPFESQAPRQVAQARVLGQLLDDQLWRAFRRTGVSYAPSAEPVHSGWLDLLVLNLPARDPSSDPGRALRELLAQLRDGKFAPGDLERARAAVRGTLQAIDDDPAALAATLAAGGKGWHSAEVAAEVERLDRDGLAAAAHAWLDPATSIAIYLGSRP